MIEINLLPQEERSGLKEGIRIDMDMLNKAAKRIILASFFLPVLFQCLIFVNQARLSALKKSLLQISLQSSRVDLFREKIGEYTKLSGIREELTRGRFNVSLKMNIISNAITRGVWLKELTMSKDRLMIKGSCVYSSSGEFPQINQFFNSLKDDKRITDSFKQLQLASVQRSMFQGVEVVDFTVSAQVQKKK